MKKHANSCKCNACSKTWSPRLESLKQELLTGTWKLEWEEARLELFGKVGKHWNGDDIAKALEEWEITPDAMGDSTLSWSREKQLKTKTGVCFFFHFDLDEERKKFLGFAEAVQQAGGKMKFLRGAEKSMEDTVDLGDFVEKVLDFLGINF